MTPHESPALALDEPQGRAARVALGTWAVLLRGFARERASELIAAIDAIAAISPFRHMVTPGGWEMSVALTNCGQVGWVTDRSGYRYDPTDPATGQPWPGLRVGSGNPASDRPRRRLTDPYAAVTCTWVKNSAGWCAFPIAGLA
jgi:alkylated DNA repair dioxygenase AlkB